MPLNPKPQNPLNPEALNPKLYTLCPKTLKKTPYAAPKTALEDALAHARDQGQAGDTYEAKKGFG